ncbi:MAG: AAA family ATPase, partial [Candidatus Paceibacterota bacterium]
GSFTETVRHRPYSVILFDEIEKAHPEVFNVLLQVLDNGRLTDAKGRVVNFKNTVIILTSNIGSQYIDKMEHMGFTGDNSQKGDYIHTKEKVMGALKDFFRPEFLNRLDDIVLFDILTPEAIRQIVDIQIGLVKERLIQKEIALELNPEVINYLSKEGYNPQYGARPLKRLIQDKILNPVASLMISRGVMSGGTIFVTLGQDKKFVFEVKKSEEKRVIKNKKKKEEEQELLIAKK